MELFSLKDKVIIITGASGILGREHSKAIAKAGGIPILIDLDKEKLAIQVKSIFDEYKIRTKAYKLDITDEISVKKYSNLIKNHFGRIDGLINNAANNPKVESGELNFSRLENFSVDSWNKDISVSLTGSFICTKYFGFEISKNPNGGSIINVSSDLGIIAPNQSIYKKEGLNYNDQPVKPVSYSVSKHGIIGLTKYTSTYWADKGVRCNAICPGGIETNQPEEFLQKISKEIPMGRLAQKDEYHGVVVWILSDASSYLNGAIIPIDGGRTAW